MYDDEGVQCFINRCNTLDSPFEQHVYLTFNHFTAIESYRKNLFLIWIGENHKFWRFVFLFDWKSFFVYSNMFLAKYELDIATIWNILDIQYHFRRKEKKYFECSESSSSSLSSSVNSCHTKCFSLNLRDSQFVQLSKSFSSEEKTYLHFLKFPILFLKWLSIQFKTYNRICSKSMCLRNKLGKC